MLSAEREALFELFVRRVYETRGKSHLEGLLRAIKEEQNVPLKAFRVTGTSDKLLETVKVAADGGWLTERRLARLVDELEENGRQHIFLFELTPAGRAHLTEARLGHQFQTLPTGPTPGLYADLPAAKRTHFGARPDGLVVKQVFRAEYWEFDREGSQVQSTPDQRVSISRRHTRRAINLLIVHPETNALEIRIDRVRSQKDDSMALELLTEFLADLAPALDVQTHIRPIDMARALRTMATNREEIYLNADDALDPSAQISLSNRRTRDRGPDIRDHEKYTLAGVDCVRTGLSPYWIINGNYHEKLFTSVSIVQVAPLGACGKVYVSATLRRNVLRHVVDRIRHFARPAP